MGTGDRRGSGERAARVGDVGSDAGSGAAGADVAPAGTRPVPISYNEPRSAALLLIATVLALLWANLPGGTYQAFWHTELGLSLGDVEFSMDLKHWVNDGLMAFFFFAVGLEVKRELAIGELTDGPGPWCRSWPRWPGWPCRR